MLLLFSNTKKASSVSKGAPVITASDPFTGADGSAWSSNWTMTHVVGTGSETIQGNTGLMVTGNGSYATERAYYSGMPTQTDTDVTITFTRNFSSEQYISLTVDGDNTSWSSDSSYVNNGLIAYISFSGGSFGTLALIKMIGGAQSQLGSGYGILLVPGTAYKWRLQYKAGTLRTKIWTASTVEPSSWQLAVGVSNPLPPAGKVSLMAQTGASGSISVNWDEAAVSDGTFTPTVGQVEAAVSTAQYAIKPVKVWTGSAWVQKPLKIWTGSAWVPTYDATPLIYSEYEDSGDPGTYLGNVLSETAVGSATYNINEQASMVEDPNDPGTYIILTY